MIVTRTVLALSLLAAAAATTAAVAQPRSEGRAAIVQTLVDCRKLTDGAQRLAWGPVWRDARAWFNGKLAQLNITPEVDAAGNSWATLKGASDDTVIIGGHLDSVPNGGWLDGALGVMVGLEALRIYSGTRPAVTIKVVDWADEEGARFGRSLLGSSAASGSLQVPEVEHLADKSGVTLIEALRDNGVELSRMHEAHEFLKAINAKAYLELHIEPVSYTHLRAPRDA